MLNLNLNFFSSMLYPSASHQQRLEFALIPTVVVKNVVGLFAARKPQSANNPPFSAGTPSVGGAPSLDIGCCRPDMISARSSLQLVNFRINFTSSGEPPMLDCSPSIVRIASVRA